MNAEEYRNTVATTKAQLQATIKAQAETLEILDCQIEAPLIPLLWKEGERLYCEIGDAFTLACVERLERRVCIAGAVITLLLNYGMQTDDLFELKNAEQTQNERKEIA